MPQIGRGGAITLTAVYRDGSLTAVDPVGANVDIIDALGATVVLNAVPVHDGVGEFHYVYSVAANAPLGAWQIVWQGTINGAPVEAIEGFTVVEAGSIDFGGGEGGACDLWCTSTDVAACCSATLSADQVTEGIQVATDILYRLSGEKYPGICSDSVRPVNDGLVGLGGDKYLRDAVIQGKLWSYDYRGCGLHGFAGCGCRNFQQVRLGGYPITSVTEVLLDGAVLDPTKYAVLDQEWLVRTDDGTWPCCQDPRQPSTEVDTFEVSYTYGIAPPVSGTKAAAKLACEIAKACADDDTCELPARLTSLTRQGVSMAVLDPQDFLDHGRTGLYLVDLFLKAHNPSGDRAVGASIQSPDYGPLVRRRG